MSAWSIPDEVVEALADRICRHDVDQWAPCGPCRTQARDFLERHRLVAIPEGADHERKWGLRYTDGSVSFRWDSEDDARWVLARATPGQLEPVIVPIDYFRIPGQPIPVDKEESDGDE